MFFYIMWSKFCVWPYVFSFLCTEHEIMDRVPHVAAVEMDLTFSMYSMAHFTTTLMCAARLSLWELFCMIMRAADCPLLVVLRIDAPTKRPTLNLMVSKMIY